ncbi:MAG: hypothetical protein ABI718_10235 [Acidobacteriota bacterium]
MRRNVNLAGLSLAALLAAISSFAAVRSVPLTSTKGLTVFSGKLTIAQHGGRTAGMLVGDREAEGTTSAAIALVDLPAMHNGTIEIDLAGETSAGADETARGFVGVVFRSTTDASHFEYFYIRPLNARDPDQLRRNHSTQYASHPDYSWKRLRKESPGVYESYADLQPGVWTHVRIVVRDSDASFYVGDASQPCLVVHDLKLGAAASGAVGLWIGDQAIGYFSDLKITTR